MVVVRFRQWRGVKEISLESSQATQYDAVSQGNCLLLVDIRKMTDLGNVLPDFPFKEFNHLLPSLEKSLITTTDLLTLHPSDVARRARIPTTEAQRLVQHTASLLQGAADPQTLRTLAAPRFISTLDQQLDAALGGGFPAGHLVEVAGDRLGSPSRRLPLIYVSPSLTPQVAPARPSSS